MPRRERHAMGGSKSVAVAIHVAAGIGLLATGVATTTRPAGNGQQVREKESNRLPKVSVSLLGPVASLSGHNWVKGDQGEPLSATAADRPHELTIRLPNGKALCTPSKMTFFTQYSGTVAIVNVVPQAELSPFPAAVGVVRKLLKDWGAKLTERSESHIAEWLKLGNIPPDAGLDSSFTGDATFSDGQAEVFFEVRPGSGGWFASVTVAAPEAQREKLLGLTPRSAPATRPASRPTTPP